MANLELTRRRGWLLAIMATLTMTVSIMDRGTLAVLAPTVTATLGMSEVDYGWVNSAFSIAYLFCAPLAGRMIDRVGARRGLFVSVIVWSFVAALHALVPSFAILLLLRVALGVAESPSFPGASQIVQRALPLSDRARGYGILLVGSALAGAIGPPLVTTLNARFGFRVAFLGSSAVAMLLWIPLWRWFAFAPDARRALDAVPEASPGGDSPRAIALTTLMRHRAVIRMFIAMIAIAPSIAFWTVWSSKFLVARYHVDQNALGRYLWVSPIFLDVGMVLFGDLASRRANARRDGSPHRALFAVATLLAGTQLAMALTPPILVALAIMAVASLGVGGYISLLTSETYGRVPAAAVSRVGGLFASAQSLCFIVDYPLLGRLVQGAGYPTVTVVTALMVLPGGLYFALGSAPALHDERRAKRQDGALVDADGA